MKKVLLCCLFFLMLGCQQEVQVQPQVYAQEAKVVEPESPVNPLLQLIDTSETDDQFKKSTVLVGEKNSPLFHKELVKNPEKHKGKRINFTAKIMKIEEDGGQSIIQAYINRDYDVVIIYYPKSIDAYDGDIIKVYGVSAGKMEGTNAMGAELAWPLIVAKHVEKNKP